MRKRLPSGAKRSLPERQRPEVRFVSEVDAAAFGAVRRRGCERSSPTPKFVSNRTKAEEERQNREAEYLRAEAPLVNERRAAGFHVHSAWDMVNTSGSYPKAVPILLGHLSRPYPAPVASLSTCVDTTRPRARPEG
jgi:hypothetical protein